MLDQPARRRAGESLIDTLAGIHAVDVDAVGLGDLARREGYIARQLKRWYSPVRAVQGHGRPERAGRSTRSTTCWSDRIPTRWAAAIVHGDYRLDNCIVGRRRDGAGRARLGAVHPRRPAGRPRHPDGLLGRAGRPVDRPRWRRRPRRRASRREPSFGTATPSAPAGISPSSSSTWPSATGSWPACSPGCSPATPGGPAAATQSDYRGFGDQVRRLGRQCRRPVGQAGMRKAWLL